MKRLIGLIMSMAMYSSFAQNSRPADTSHLKYLARYSNAAKAFSQRQKEHNYYYLGRIMIVTGGAIILTTAFMLPWRKEKGLQGDYSERAN